MIVYCVIHRDEQQGEMYINGPFYVRELACAWAKKFATDKAAEFSMKLDGIDGYFQISDGNDEIVAEISVDVMITPYPED
jgi:hypothetical protein